MELQSRKNIRVKNYDYAQNGAYFITICAKDRKNLFWDIGATLGRQNNAYVLSEIGRIVDNETNKLSGIYDNIKIDNYVIMPNR
jgi:REP element-mobilizing transposase RayT